MWNLCKQVIVLLPFIFALPGFLLHLPIAMITKWKALSVASRQAARSEVKIEGRDVIASTKVCSQCYLDYVLANIHRLPLDL